MWGNACVTHVQLFIHGTATTATATATTTTTTENNFNLKYWIHQKV